MDYTIASNTTAVGAGDAPPATGTPGEFTEGNPATSTPATTVPGYQLNALVREIRNAIVGLGLTPSKDVTSQLLGALSVMGIPAADTGAVNAYATTLDPSITAHTPGMTVKLTNILNTNTGAATFDDGHGALPIVSASGVALQGGELVASYDAQIVLNHAGTEWTLLQTTGGPLPIPPGVKSQHAVNLGQFPATLSANGYQKLPGGLIIQWGTYTNPGSVSSGSASYPIAFPNNVFSLVVTRKASVAASTSISVNAGTTGFGWQESGTAYPSFYWIVVGN